MKPIKILQCLNENVDMFYFDKFNDTEDEYMPSNGEGDTLAEQIVVAIGKLIYHWYNDGDVYENTYYLPGANNDYEYIY